MKSITKKISLAGLGAACVLSLSLGAGMLTKTNNFAKAEEESANIASSYFYDNLRDSKGDEYTLAKKFYNVLAEMNEDGDFVDGVVDYNIEDIVTSDDLKGWIDNGDLTVPKAFSAARDAFKTDHPELFYIDLYKMTISVATSGGQYVGYLNSGREANLYCDNGFNSQTEVEAAIEKYENRIDEIVDIVNASAATNTLVARDVFLAKEVNTYLAQNIKYDYVAYENMDDPNYIAAAYINTPYGGLVEGKAVCGGFSTAYKVIMDKLGIPCITVNGYSNNRDESGNNSGTSVYHMWNYVYLENPTVQSKARAASDGAWYSVDVTWDKSAYSLTRFAVLSEPVDSEIHVTDGVISSGGYELIYPELSPYTYGGTVDTDGLQLTLTYEETIYEDDFGGILYNTFYHVSYNGKGAKRLLEEDGLYLALRYARYEQVEGTDEMQLEWTSWNAIEYWRILMVDMGFGGENAEDMIKDSGNETRVYGNTSEYFVQAAVFDAAPDRATYNGWEDEYPGADPTYGFDPVSQYYYFYYFSNDLLEKTTAVAVSDVATNEAYGTYTPPPYIVYDQTVEDRYTAIRAISDSMRRGNTNLMDPKNAFTLTATYDQDLHIIDPSQPIGIYFTTIHPNTQKYAFFVTFDDGEYVHLLEDNRTLEFRFCPSLMYEHNNEDYHFFFTNVGSAELIKVKDENGNLVDRTSDKLPNSALFCFERVYMACPKVFNYDGRLWVDCCAQPQLVANSDLSAMDFKTADGESTFSENQRSQMMLVAERASSETVGAMLDGIGDIEGSNVTSNDVITSTTYDIYLSMCNQTPVIPDGSYVKLALGFPEGFGPEDEGVTFKIYHRKHVQGDEYIIEEVPCVVTQFGIVVVCTSFSPYMVAVVDEEFATTKNVYASIEGKGGTLTNEDGRIQALNEGDSYTYTIQPNDGYQIYSVKLNGVEVSDSVVDGKLTVNYEDLGANNELVIQYIADEAAARVQQKKDNNEIDEAVELTLHVVPTSVVIAGDKLPSTGDIGNTGNSGNSGNGNGAAVAIAIVCVVIVVAVAATLAVVIIRKKKD